MSTLPLLAVSLFWPALLPWLLAVAIPVVLFWSIVSRAVPIGWGAIDLVRRAARTSWASQKSASLMLTLVRVLLVMSVVLAATRPYFTGDTSSLINVLRSPAFEKRIEVVCRSGESDGSQLGIGKALQSLAQARPQSIPSPDVVAIDEAGHDASRKQLIILSDGLIPQAEDIQRLNEKVRRGASLLVCIGNKSLLSASQPRLAAWLENVSGIRLTGSVSLAHEPIECGHVVADDQLDFTSPLSGPRVWRLMQLEPVETSSQTSVLLVTSQTHRPLILESKVGRGRVVVSAIPLELSGEKSLHDNWSDLVAWPSFLPLLDGLVERWLEPVAAEAGSSETRDRVETVIPLSHVFLIMSVIFFMLEFALSRHQRFFGNETLSMGVILLRVAMFVLLGVMLFVWNDVPANTIERATESPIAVIIDVSPSMATKVSGVDVPSGSIAEGSSRLMVGINALTAKNEEVSVLDQLSRYRRVLIYLASEKTRLLGTYPEEVTAAELQKLAVEKPGPNASRLGDAVSEIIRQENNEKPASVVVVSDGAITGGLSWLSAARLAFEQNVPLVAMPIGDDSTPGERLPTGFRFSSIYAPGVYQLNDSIQISCEGIASSKKIKSLAWQVGETKGELEVHASPTARGYSYAGAGEFSFQSNDVFKGDSPGSVDDSLVLSHAVEVTVGTEKNGRHVGVVPLIISNSPIRVLLVDHTPRFEFRYLQQLLNTDKRFVTASCLLAGRDTVDLRTKHALPRTVSEWNTYDVVVLGDIGVAAAEKDAIAWESLREAVSQFGVGVVWLPGQRWFDEDMGLESWLPAAPVLAVDAPRPSSIPKHFRVLATGTRPSWFSWLDNESTKDSFNGLNVFSRLPKVSIHPSVRVVAVAETPAEDIPQPAIVVGKLGKGDILGHFFDTWRWQATPRDKALRHYSEYWLRAIPYLAERHLESRFVVATVSIRPPDPMSGEDVFIDVIPTRDTTVFRDWHLRIESDGRPMHQFSLEKHRPDSVTTVQVQGLLAGSYKVNLIPPEEIEDKRARRVEVPLTVNAWPMEQSPDASGTGPMRTAMHAEKGRIITTDNIGSMPEHIIHAVADVDARYSDTSHWLASQFAAHCFVAVFFIMCIIVWWPPRTHREMII